MAHDTRRLTRKEWRQIERDMVENILVHTLNCRSCFDPETPEYRGYTLAVMGLRAMLVGWESRETQEDA